MGIRQQCISEGNQMIGSKKKFKQALLVMEEDVIKHEALLPELIGAPPGRQIYLAFSWSIENKTYIVTHWTNSDSYECECDGFRYQKKCHHIRSVIQNKEKCNKFNAIAKKGEGARYAEGRYPSELQLRILETMHDGKWRMIQQIKADHKKNFDEEFNNGRISEMVRMRIIFNTAKRDNIAVEDVLPIPPEFRFERKPRYVITKKGREILDRRNSDGSLFQQSTTSESKS